MTDSNEGPTIYVAPWKNIPAGVYYLHTTVRVGNSEEPAVMKVAVERSQHGHLYIRYLQESPMSNANGIHRIFGLNDGDVLRPVESKEPKRTV